MIGTALLWLRANPLLMKIGAGLALLIALIGWHASTVHLAHQAGIEQESTRRDAIDAANALFANRKLLEMNERLRAAQADLAAARFDLQKLQQENDREKAISSQRQSDLLAGRERMSVLVKARACNPADAGSPASAGTGTVDPGASVTADLDGRTAAAIDAIRSEHNEAIRRLGACIKAYDAVKAAADASEVP